MGRREEGADQTLLSNKISLSWQEEGGGWRGDPMRPLLLVDSPGVGGGEAADQTALINTAKLLKEFRQEIMACVINKIQKCLH